MACSKSSETRVASHINLTQLAVYQTQHTILVYYKIILEFTAYFQVCVNSSDLEIPLWNLCERKTSSNIVHE